MDYRLSLSCPSHCPFISPFAGQWAGDGALGANSLGGAQYILYAEEATTAFVWVEQEDLPYVGP